MIGLILHQNADTVFSKWFKKSGKNGNLNYFHLHKIFIYLITFWTHKKVFFNVQNFDKLKVLHKKYQ